MRRGLGGAGVLVVTTLLVGAAAPPGSVTRRPGEPDVYWTAEADAEMQAAIARARDTIQQFVARLSAPPAGQTFTAVKAAFELGEAVEHVWLTDVRYRDGAFVGTVSNVPLGARGVKAGDRVAVPLARVSDWMAVERGRLVGGYTIRVLRGRMSAEERRAFDAQVDFVVD
jgi:uncharacterized protein YegJ (DUF2314 family)